MNRAQRASQKCKRSGRIRKTLFCVLTVGGSLIFSFFAAELVIAHFFPQALTGTLRVFDERGLILHEKNRVIRLPSGVYYQTDSQGLRFSGAQIMSGSAFRVLVLGDSFTFGWRLHFENTFVAHLQRLVDAQLGPGRVVFLNGGHMGWGASDYVSFAEHYAKQIRTDAILIFLNAFDIDRSIRNKRYKLRDENALELEEKRVFWPAMKTRMLTRYIPGYQWLLEHSQLVQVLRKGMIMVISRSPQKIEAHNDDGVDPVMLGRALFHQLKTFCDANRYGLFVITTGFVKAEIEGMETSTFTRAFIDGSDHFFEEEGIGFYDIGLRFHEYVRGDYSTVVFPKDPHPNELGAKYIAELNWPYLRNWLSVLLKQ
jgi:lysophospholipase L1-like esterase